MGKVLWFRCRRGALRCIYIYIYIRDVVFRASDVADDFDART